MSVTLLNKTESHSRELIPLNLDSVKILADIARIAGQEIQKIAHSGSIETQIKADESPVTAADKASQQIINQLVAQHYPELPILGEENVSVPLEVRRSWPRHLLVDPLDGTKDFIAGTGEYSVNLAVIENGIPVIGVVHCPETSVTVAALKGVGVWQFDNTTAAWSEIKSFTESDQKSDLQLVTSRQRKSPLYEQLAQALGGKELLHSGASLKVCQIANRVADATIQFGKTSEWDNAAAQCILEQLGGCLTDHQGRALIYNQNESVENPPVIMCKRGDLQRIIAAIEDINSATKSSLPSHEKTYGGIGATEELSLRVSTASLTSFEVKPKTFALECKASCEIIEGKEKVRVQIQPIGGASVLLQPAALVEAAGDFNYDSEKSREDNDFRVFIAPNKWDAVKAFCEAHFKDPSTGIIESEPAREIQEEIEEMVGVVPEQSQYHLTQKGIYVQNADVASTRIGSAGVATKRVFNLFNTQITDPSLAEAVCQKAAQTNIAELTEHVLEKARSSGGKAKLSGIITVTQDFLEDAYRRTLAGEKVTLQRAAIADTVWIAHGLMS